MSKTSLGTIAAAHTQHRKQKLGTVYMTQFVLFVQHMQTEAIVTAQTGINQADFRLTASMNHNLL